MLSSGLPSTTMTSAHLPAPPAVEAALLGQADLLQVEGGHAVALAEGVDELVGGDGGHQVRSQDHHPRGGGLVQEVAVLDGEDARGKGVSEGGGADGGGNADLRAAP